MCSLSINVCTIQSNLLVMTIFKKLFHFSGLSLRAHEKSPLIWFTVRMVTVWTFYVAGLMRNLCVPTNYMISLNVSILVYSSVFLCITVAFVETMRTISEQRGLYEKLSEIDTSITDIANKLCVIKVNSRTYLAYIGIFIMSPIIFVPLGITQDYVGFYYHGLYPQCFLKLRVLQMIIFLDELHKRMQMYNQVSQRRNRRLIQLKRTFQLFLEYKELYHKCFQNSMFFIIVYNFFDFICMTHRLLMTVVGTLHWTYAVMSLAVLLPLGMNIAFLNVKAQGILNEVSIPYGLY